MKKKLYSVEKDGKIIEYYYFSENRVNPRLEVVLGKMHIHISSKVTRKECGEVILKHFDEYYEAIQNEDYYAKPFKIRDEAVKVKIIEGARDISVSTDGDILTIMTPSNVFSGSIIKGALARICLKIYDEIKSEIEEILGAKKIDFEHTIYRYRSSMFGCFNHNKKDITINSILAMYDIKYFKSVLLHEYAHSRILNHGKEFHTLLEEMTPNHRLLMKELNKKGIPKAVLIIPADSATKEILLQGGCEYKGGVSVLLDY